MAIEVLVAHQLGQDFPGVRLFESLNLSVAEGEQVAIVGRSGSGKTTLLNLLAGLSMPSQGEVRLCGQAYPPQCHCTGPLARRSVGDGISVPPSAG